MHTLSSQMLSGTCGCPEPTCQQGCTEHKVQQCFRTTINAHSIQDEELAAAIVMDVRIDDAGVEGQEKTRITGQTRSSQLKHHDVANATWNPSASMKSSDNRRLSKVLTRMLDRVQQIYIASKIATIQTAKPWKQRATIHGHRSAQGASGYRHPAIRSSRGHFLGVMTTA